MTRRSAAAASSVPTRALARDHARPDAHETAAPQPAPVYIARTWQLWACRVRWPLHASVRSTLGEPAVMAASPMLTEVSSSALALALLLPLLVNLVAEQHLRTKRTRTRLKPPGICDAQDLLCGCLLVRLQLLVPVLILDADPTCHHCPQCGSYVARTSYGHRMDTYGHHTDTVRTRTDTYGHVRTRTDITTDVQADIVRTSYGHHTDIIRTSYGKKRTQQVTPLGYSTDIVPILRHPHLN